MHSFCSWNKICKSFAFHVGSFLPVFASPNNIQSHILSAIFFYFRKYPSTLVSSHQGKSNQLPETRVRFEEKDDDFCCGRAYGGSRVAVVSTARYNPNIDGVQNIDRIHSWPASHCETYVEDCCSELSQPVRKPQRKKEKTEIVDLSSSSSPPTSIKSNTTSSLKAAVDDFRASLTSEEHASSSWLARVCRTSSHELGHCFGMDHCIYYACVMQGTATLAEDSRQPPYLCPIDMAKVNRATGVGEKDRYQVLGAFCEKYKRTAFFAAFSAWIQERLAFLGEEQVSLLI